MGKIRTPNALGGVCKMVLGTSDFLRQHTIDRQVIVTNMKLERGPKTKFFCQYWCGIIAVQVQVKTICNK